MTVVVLLVAVTVEYQGQGHFDSLGPRRWPGFQHFLVQARRQRLLLV
jgi:hypothetical protein